MKKFKYKGSQREYTVFGISSVFKTIVDREFMGFFGGKTLSNLYFVIRDGIFYHFQIEEEVVNLNKIFLERVRDGKILLNEVYSEYDADVSRLEKIYQLSKESYNFEILKEFYFLYSKFIKIAYVSFYSADYVDQVIMDKEKAKDVLDWIIKIRKRGEDIYKYGENVFVPRYTEWLAENIDGNYSASELQYVTHKEFLDFMDKSEALPSKEELINRAKYFFGHYYPIGKEKYLSGSVALKEVARLKLFKEIDSEASVGNEFSGQIAFKGKVTGKVVLISKRDDMAKFKDGEIIVSPMTEPGYIPIMKKAIAFVTNEGGMLCHAAIVAREMKKPCIIGTKIATKVLKDGMMVEVDAERGIVKVLERSDKLNTDNKS